MCVSKQILFDILFRIPAHKIVLVSCSEYFAAMFTGSLQEATSSEITLERVDPQALKTLVHYCYTGIIGGSFLIFVIHNFTF